MKAENIFDYLESENTVNGSIIEETGVNVENVIKLVKQNLESEDNGGKIKPIRSKRKTAGKLFAIIAAAVIATAVTAQALGSFKDVFGDFLIGESPDGIYSGSNLSIESKTSDIEFLGIAGDKNTAVTSMRIRNNDGTPYVDDIDNTWISTSSSEKGEHNLYQDIGREEINYTRSKWSEFTDREPIVSYIGFYFEDSSTINAYILSNGDEGGIKGETMTAEVSNLSAYKCKEILYDFSEHYTENIDDEGYYSNEDFNEKLIELVKEYGFDEKDGKRLMLNPETKDIVLAEETPLDVEFKLSVKMDYRTSSRTLDAENLSECTPSWNTGTLNVQPFTIILKADKEESAADISSAENPLPSVSNTYPDTLKITLEDGSSVTAYLQNVTSNDNSCTITYRYYNDNGDGSRFRPIAINPNSVASVEVNDVKVYE